MPYGITRCYLPPGRTDIPAVTPAEAGTRFSDAGDTEPNVAGGRPGTSLLLGVTRWETVKGLGLEFLEQRAWGYPAF